MCSIKEIRTTTTHIFNSSNHRYETLEIKPSQTPFRSIFNPIPGVNTGIFYKTIHPQSITLSIQDVFITYLDKLIEHSENLELLLYLISHLESLNEKKITLKYQILKQRYNDMTILINDCNNIYHKSNTSNTNFLRK